MKASTLLLLTLFNLPLLAQNGVFWGYELSFQFDQSSVSAQDIVGVEILRESVTPAACTAARVQCTPMITGFDLETLCFTIVEGCGGIGGSCNQVQPPTVYLQLDLATPKTGGRITRHQKIIPFEFDLVPYSRPTIVVGEIDLGNYLLPGAPAIVVQVDVNGTYTIQEQLPARAQEEVAGLIPWCSADGLSPQ